MHLTAEQRPGCAGRNKTYVLAVVELSPARIENTDEEGKELNGREKIQPAKGRKLAKRGREHRRRGLWCELLVVHPPGRRW